MLFHVGHCRTLSAHRLRHRRPVSPGANSILLTAAMTGSAGNVLSEANGLMIKLLPYQP
ncbi:hypothetical protein ACGFK1_01470 [Mycobacterium sp. NPDC048908]|uniref:hypothetical protein n=1 Tax=Mycobacterium sp. NPDC048908 TaxID=3364292 RepID=UPI0037107F86